MLDQFHMMCHPYIDDVIVDSHFDALLGWVKNLGPLSDVICLKNLFNDVMNMQD